MNKFSIAKATVLLVLSLSAANVNAQQQMEPFPAVEIGQRIEIQSSDPLWTSLFEAANASMVAGQTALNTGQDPTGYISCTATVCCETVEFWNALLHKWVFVTRCWGKSSGKELTNIIQTY